MRTFNVNYWTGSTVEIEPLQATSFHEAVAVAEKRHGDNLLGIHRPGRVSRPAKQ